MVNFLNKIISFSFYALFFFVPIVFTSNTSELFEFNKMWLTFGITIVITAAWLWKMTLQKRIFIQRTPLDISILLFLLSQFLSTIMSLDPHTSIWGYYSRFNGGFLSLLSYAILFYAFVTHAASLGHRVTEAGDPRRAPGLSGAKEAVGRGWRLAGPYGENPSKKFIFFSLFSIILSGIVVSLWGLPSHFGYDPTCLLFRGTFDVSCWTNAFQPKVRIFSTLGQPDWLSAYLAVLVPLGIGMGIYFFKKNHKSLAIGFLLATILFFIDFLYARSRGGFAGLVTSLVIMFAWYLLEEKKNITKFLATPTKLFHQYSYVLILIVCLAISTFSIGTSVDQIDKFMLPGIVDRIQSHVAPATVQHTPKPKTPASSPVVSTGELGGTDSGKIRLYVWSGAIEAWKHYPIFGTGVETFAYAYFLFMPPAHNLTSEFGYLYNKAHNEYLNYLATTGIVGLGTYLFMIGWFLLFAIKGFKKSPTTNHAPITAGLLASYIGILVTNFFGFSVVMINIFLFLIPGLVFLLQDQLDENNSLSFPKIINHQSSIANRSSAFQWIACAVIGIIAVYFLYTLGVYWYADTQFGLGQNLVNAGDYQSAYQPLHQAAELRPSEPTFLDELALDDAVLAVGLAQQNKSVNSTVTQLAQEAVTVSNDLTTNHPNVVSYWKTRVRIMYTLSQLNPQYLQDALTAIEKASQLAPTDAKVSYNLGLLEGQTGHLQDAIATLQNTIRLKKDYHEAYYALGLFYHSAGVDKNGNIIHPDDIQKGIDEMHFILENFNSQDQQALAALKAWHAE